MDCSRVLHQGVLIACLMVGASFLYGCGGGETPPPAGNGAQTDTDGGDTDGRGTDDEMTGAEDGGSATENGEPAANGDPEPGTDPAAATENGGDDTAASTPVPIDPALPDYKAIEPGPSGTINSVGSDTMNNMMTLWQEGFKKFYPAVNIEIEGKGSSTAPVALIEGTAQFGPMSREMKASEIDAFEEKFGYKPVQLPSAIDLLAVYVNKDNPVDGLSLPQIDAMFSKTRKLGHPEDISSWGELGLTGDWENAPISLYGRNSASGTYGYFKEKALGGGDYKDKVKEQPGSSSVVQGIASDKFAIGYSGIGYMTADVRAVPLATIGTDYVVPSSENAAEYPLSRALWISVNYEPNSELDPLRREFLRFIYSTQGQEAVVKDGYLPVTAGAARVSLQKVGIEPGF